MGSNELGEKGLVCEVCKEVHHFKDELVFYLGDTEVYVTEQYPDWNRCVCISCDPELYPEKYRPCVKKKAI